MIDRYGRVPLHYAAAEGDLARATSLVRVSPDDVRASDKSGFTPLHFAAQSNAVDVAVLLLRHDAEVDARNRFGNTPLFVAVMNSRGFGGAIAALRGAGADPYAVNSYGNTPVSVARSIANFDVAQFFADLA